MWSTRFRSRQILSFAIASVTKLFTGTAVLQLIEQGKLNLTGALGQHLPRFAQSVAADSSPSRILAHQSGIKSYTEVPEYWETTRLDIPKEQLLALVADFAAPVCPW